MEDQIPIATKKVQHNVVSRYNQSVRSKADFALFSVYKHLQDLDYDIPEISDQEFQRVVRRLERRKRTVPVPPNT